MTTRVLLALPVLVFAPASCGKQSVLYTLNGDALGASVIGTQDSPLEWGFLDLNSLISRLPTIGSETVSWDKDNREWINHPAVSRIQDRIEGGAQLSDTQWAAALLNSGAIRMRSKWPRDISLAVSMRVPRWLPLGKITMTPTMSSSLSPAEVGSTMGESCGTYALGRRERAAYQELGILPLGKHELTFAIEIEREKDRWFDDEVLPVWAGPISLTVEIVSSVDEVLPPIRDQNLDDAVAESLWIQRFGFVRDGEPGTGEALVFWGSPAAFETLRGVAVGIEAELWHETELVETKRDPPGFLGHRS